MCAGTPHLLSGSAEDIDFIILLPPEGRHYTLMRSEAENTGQSTPSVQLSALYPLSGSHSSPTRCPHQGKPCSSLGSLMTEMPSPEEAFVSLCCCSVGRSCLTLCDPMDCSPPGSWFLGPWGFSQQEYQSGLPCPPPGDLPSPGIEYRSAALQEDFFYQLSYPESWRTMSDPN